MNPTTVSLGTRAVGDGAPCFVLAEVASAHGGSIDTALKMLEAAFKMGADGINATRDGRTSTRSSWEPGSGASC